MEDWVKIQSFDRIHQAEWRKDLLESNDIRAVVINERDSIFLMGEIKLYVRKEDEKKALALIEEFQGLTKIDSFILRQPIENLKDVLDQNTIYAVIKTSKNDIYRLTDAFDRTNFKIKNIRFYDIPKNLSKKLKYKIIKESLILGLRQELKHNEKMKRILNIYLKDVNRLKEKVKRNKEEVQQNCENIKNEFHDRFLVVEAYEKQINILNEEKKEIIRTNEEIIAMKAKQTTALKNQLNKVQKETNAQMEEIKELNNKIEELEKKKAGLNDEFDEIVKKQETDYKKMKEEFIALCQKCDYYEYEYNKFDKYPEEKLKDNINLFDNTKTKAILTEENLKIALIEKNFVRDKLINNLNTMHKKIDAFEEKQKEMKKKEKLYGKPLNSLNVKSTLKTTLSNKKTLYSNTYTNTNHTTQSNKRAKTFINKKSKNRF